ncbi:MAG: hypothetical protein HY746_00175 [Elusimicrobia bacterium]|nr:hypothetical protein [Elusimicrobiota bacterium]
MIAYLKFVFKAAVNTIKGRKNSFIYQLNLSIFYVLWIIVLSPLYIHAAVTDTVEYLIIPPGETYALDGFHSYTKQVKVEGTLAVRGYNGTGTTRLKL